MVIVFITPPARETEGGRERETHTQTNLEIESPVPTETLKCVLFHSRVLAKKQTRLDENTRSVPDQHSLELEQTNIATARPSKIINNWMLK
jgi:hypothetical protein